ncbi:MAG: carboxypeptidase regulatory-like domain-containing protein, partial [Clostridiales bacterium]|nr:carboxypeptidase regulatory-like domain-containing protein [Clostridiales bacterium]
MKKVLVTILLFLASALFSAAQISQTGTLNGTVYDQDRQPLPGVTVTIKSPVLILPQMDTVTTERGHFRFPALPPGEYTATFTLSGFKTLIREGIRVTVGVTTTLDVVLEQTTLEESITVTGKSPTVDIQRTSRAVNLTKDILQNLPAARNLGTYFNMAPGVTSSTVHGSSERDNTYNIDGVNVTDPVTGTTGGGFSIDIMEELSIQTGGLPAEYGSVRGGVVNVVTKSGGNKFSGSAIGYYQNKDLQSVNNKGTIFEGQKGGTEYEFEPSLTFGGPIIKDKIWVFLTGTHRKIKQYVLGYPWDQTDNVPIDYTYYMPFGKITSQLTKKDRVVLSFNYYDFIRHHRGASTSRNIDSTWDQTTPIYTYNFQLTHFFGPNLFMNFKVSYLNYHLNLTAKNDKVQIYDSAISKYTQSYGYDDVYSRDRFQALTDATYFIDEWLGSHELKLGAEFE